METIDIDGVRYIRASSAARELGYTADYVGQLSRAGKISARQVGRVWYIKDGELVRHKKDNVRSNRQKTHEAVKAAMHSHDEHQIHHVLYDPHAVMPEYRKRLMAVPVKYEKDHSPISIAPRRDEAHVQDSPHEIVNQVPQGEKVVVLHAQVVEESAEPEIAEEESLSEEESEVTVHPKSEYRKERSIPVHEPPREGVLSIRDLDESDDSGEEEGTGEEEDREVLEEETSFMRRLRQTEESEEDPIEELLAEDTDEPEEGHFNTDGLVSPKRRSALPSPIIVLVPALIVFSLLFSVSSVFLQGIWVYDQEGGGSDRPLYETSYGVRAVSAVAEGLASLK